MQTAGLAFVFLPSNTLAYVGIPREQNNQVSGMNAFVRNIGGSIGICVVKHHAQAREPAESEHAGPPYPYRQCRLREYGQRDQPGLAERGLEATAAAQQAYTRVMEMLQGQAITLAYVQVIMRKRPKGRPAGERAH
jgi:DHA2 family multidrug resistance protein